MKAKHLIGSIILLWIIWFIFLDAFISRKKAKLALIPPIEKTIQIEEKEQEQQDKKEEITKEKDEEQLIENSIEWIEKINIEEIERTKEKEWIKFETDNTVKITNKNWKELFIKFYYDDREATEDLHWNEDIDKTNTAFLKELNTTWNWEKDEELNTNFKNFFISNEITNHIDEKLLNFFIKFSYDIFNNINDHLLSENSYNLSIVVKDNSKKGRRWGFNELSITSWQLNLYINKKLRVLPYTNEWKSVFIHEMWHFIDLVLIKDVELRKKLEKESFYSLCREKKVDKITMKNECDKLSMFSWYSKTDMYEDFAESFLTYILFYDKLSTTDLNNFPILKKKLMFLRHIISPLKQYNYTINEEWLNSILFWENYAFYKLEEVFN